MGSVGQLDQLAHLRKKSIVVSFGLELVASAGWRDIGWRVWQEVGQDRVFLTAAGATFYLLLALFPAIAAFVALYGFVADPTTVADHVSYLGRLLPSAAGRHRHHQKSVGGARLAGPAGVGNRLSGRPGDRTLAERLADAHGLSKTQAKTVVEDERKGIADAAAKGEEISLNGFGKFRVQNKPERD